MLPFHALSWPAVRGISGYLSGRTPADHFNNARIKPFIRKTRQNWKNYYIFQVVELFCVK